jgi:hypothetical protein
MPPRDMPLPRLISFQLRHSVFAITVFLFLSKFRVGGNNGS